MRLAWAIAGGLALGAGAAWWLHEPAADRPAAGRADPAADEDHDVVYRWRDDRGVTQITRQPPEGRSFQRLEMPQARNVVPFPPEEAASPED